MITPDVTRPHPHGTGTQRIYRFDNGYGASVVLYSFAPGVGSYGAEQGLWELAVVRFTGDGLDQFKVTYETPVTNDVIGWLDEDEVQEKLQQIRDLPSVTA